MLAVHSGIAFCGRPLSDALTTFAHDAFGRVGADLPCPRSESFAAASIEG
jgi:hypothetical protein